MLSWLRLATSSSADSGRERRYLPFELYWHIVVLGSLSINDIARLNLRHRMLEARPRI